MAFLSIYKPLISSSMNPTNEKHKSKYQNIFDTSSHGRADEGNICSKHSNHSDDSYGK